MLELLLTLCTVLGGLTALTAILGFIVKRLAGNLGSLPFTVVDDRYTVNADLHVDFPAGADVLAAIRRTYPDKRRILVVEGATSTGKTPAKFLEEFAGELKGLDQNPASTADIAFVGRHGPEPWPDRFPWQSSDLYRPYLRDIFSRTAPR